MKARIATATVAGPSETIARLQTAQADLISAGGIDQLIWETAETLSVTATLAD